MPSDSGRHAYVCVCMCTHGCGGWSVDVDDAADVGPHGVDGGVGAEAGAVDAQGGGALVYDVPDDVHLHLGRREMEERWRDE